MGARDICAVIINFFCLSTVQTDATLLTNNSQHCWMLHVASVFTPCSMLLDVVACCCAKFETGQTFQPTTPNIWSPKRRATMLDPFAQLFQHCCGHARSSRMDYKDLWVVPLPTRTKQLPTLLAQQCWESLRPFARSLSFPLFILKGFAKKAGFVNKTKIWPKKLYCKNQDHHSLELKFEHDIIILENAIKINIGTVQRFKQ